MGSKYNCPTFRLPKLCQGLRTSRNKKKQNPWKDLRRGYQYMLLKKKIHSQKTWRRKNHVDKKTYVRRKKKLHLFYPFVYFFTMQILVPGTPNRWPDSYFFLSFFENSNNYFGSRIISLNEKTINFKFYSENPESAKYIPERRDFEAWDTSKYLRY